MGIIVLAMLLYNNIGIRRRSMCRRRLHLRQEIGQKPVQQCNRPIPQVSIGSQKEVARTADQMQYTVI
jgi:hypothetical protein